MPKKISEPLTWELENELHEKGYKIVCGTDEAGRGPLVGPVVAGACVLPDGIEIPGLNDSKKLTEKKREELYALICEKAVAWATGLCTPAEIDEINILNASMLAMRRAIAALGIKADAALVDGNCTRSFEIPAFAVVKGDAKSPSIAAASILAKVTRDRMCVELDREYPEYNIAKHKGYPTAEHMELVRKYGPCPEHRRTFLKFLNDEERK
ncbi:MAG: ribonuclease HII [Clostridia bacterium]|nr:ribonuclease HII [Clostridia bacterium]